jgi:hypothetical protein
MTQADIASPKRYNASAAVPLKEIRCLDGIAILESFRISHSYRKVPMIGGVIVLTFGGFEGAPERIASFGRPIVGIVRDS